MVCCICGRPRVDACVPVSRGMRACHSVARGAKESVCECVCVCALPCACAAAAVVKKSMLCGRKTVNTTFGYGFAHFAFVGGREETGDETLFSLLLSSLSLCTLLRLRAPASACVILREF